MLVRSRPVFVDVEGNDDASVVVVVEVVMGISENDDDESFS
jgi:hypothetical protein